jgi:intracellular septation protein A
VAQVIENALITLGVASVLLLCWVWRPRQAMEPGVRLLLVAYALLGGWALWFGLLAPHGQEPARFAFWKPTVLYWGLAGILLAAPALGWGYPAKAVIGTYFAFSNREWRWINLAFVALCAALGGFNLFVAFTSSRGEWEGFKFGCLVNVLGLLLLRLTFVWLDTLVRIGAYLYGRAKALFP